MTEEKILLKKYSKDGKEAGQMEVAMEVFGITPNPQPRDYSFDLPRKVRVLAIRSSLSAAQGKFKVVDDFSFLSAPKTQEMAQLLKNMGLEDKKVLILADYKAAENKNVALASRNLPGVKLRLPHNLSVRDLIDADAVLASSNAVQEINERYTAYV
jgi:large subunit ribosomal protein L4